MVNRFRELEDRLVKIQATRASSVQTPSLPEVEHRRRWAATAFLGTEQ